ncbi:MAG: phosphatidate cytidylyltransferase [Proteobacteria bacterium]|nr:phosphatidate cytidylyltransferase [Pseudomonadota bacterium]
MTETVTRILVAGAMILIAVGAAIAEYYGIHAVRWLTLAIALGMGAELLWARFKWRIHHANPRKIMPWSVPGTWMLFMLAVMTASAYYVGGRPWLILLLLLIISAADIGAWFFGMLIGGDKMWPAVSPGKTWAGQIAGVICGTLAAVLYGFIGTAVAMGHIDYGQFMPQLLWIGMSVSLLSQYGDLTASWVKRKLGIKDFSHILPGHGGITDRFDGWIYVLPLILLVT